MGLRVPWDSSGRHYVSQAVTGTPPRALVPLFSFACVEMGLSSCDPITHISKDEGL